MHAYIYASPAHRVKSAFRLGESLAVHEAMISFRGWASYVCGKPHTYGIKAFVLAYSRTKMCPYFGKETDLPQNPALLQTTLTLIEPFQTLHHYLIMVTLLLNWRWS